MNKVKVGNRYGRLVVISLHKIGKDRYYHWECQCDCGNKTIVRSTCLKNGSTKSCKCLAKESARERQLLPPGIANLNRLYKSYKHEARERGLGFNLNISFFALLTKGNCHYCGVEPQNIYKHKEKDTPYIYNGIDRMNPKYGYIQFNVVSCCTFCNYAKRDRTYEKFMLYLERLIEFNVCYKNDYSEVIEVK